MVLHVAGGSDAAGVMHRVDFRVPGGVEAHLLYPVRGGYSMTRAAGSGRIHHHVKVLTSQVVLVDTQMRLRGGMQGLSL